MSTFIPSKKSASDFNSGNKYNKNNGVTHTAFNNLIEGLLFAQESSGESSKISVWNETTTYKTGDIVQYGFNFYRCAQDNTGYSPTNTQYWSFAWSGLATGVYKGEYTFANKPSASATNDNCIFMITNKFTTDIGFIGGAGQEIPANALVKIIYDNSIDGYRYLVLNGNSGGENIQTPIIKWVSGTYKLGDVVSNTNALYRCKVATTTEEPSILANDWETLVRDNDIAVDYGGEKTFEELHTPSAIWNNYVFTITNSFVTTDDFIGGRDKNIPANAQVVIVYSQPDIAYKYLILNEQALKNLTAIQNLTTNIQNDFKLYYKKTETYSQQEIDNKISTIPKFAIKVVSTLPTQEISNTTVYLVSDSSGSSQNLYVEYIYVDGNWEKLGEQKVDLQGYVTTDALNTALESYVKTNDLNSTLNSYVKKDSLQEQLANKQDKLVDGQNIKTINNQPLTGKGNIEIKGGGGLTYLESVDNLPAVTETPDGKIYAVKDTDMFRVFIQKPKKKALPLTVTPSLHVAEKGQTYTSTLSGGTGTYTISGYDHEQYDVYIGEPVISGNKITFTTNSQGFVPFIEQRYIHITIASGSETVELSIDASIWMMALN